MEEAIHEFKDHHALLLTEIRRLDESGDDMMAARNRELRRILKVVARDFLNQKIGPTFSEEALTDWLTRLEAA